MRIVSRPDFDGLVCAVLLMEVENITEPIKWVQPNEVQNGRVHIRSGDIIANLPYDANCSMWFDHHYTNQTEGLFRGAFDIAPSAAGVIYHYYQGRFSRDFDELIRETDKIDSAGLSMDEVLHPEKYPYVLLSMTLSFSNESDESYWNHLVALLGRYDIAQVMDDPVVKARCERIIEQNQHYFDILKQHTRVIQQVSVTDFRSFETAPAGNRFLVYSIFPDTYVSVKIRNDHKDREKIILSVGHNIFNSGCKVNVGLMLADFNGGGHRGAGACTFHVSQADDYIPRILDILLKNNDNES